MATDLEADDYYADPHHSAESTASCAQFQQIIHPPLPPRTECIVRDPFLPLRNFDMLGPHHVQVLGSNARNRRRQRFLTALEHEAARQQIAFACMTDAVPARPVFDEPRAYIDDSRWYTICPEPQPGDIDFDLRNPHTFYAMSSTAMESS
jgi:hypothetical protein